MLGFFFCSSRFEWVGSCDGSILTGAGHLGMGVRSGGFGI